MLTRRSRLDQVVRLADGRDLRYAEYGRAAALPLFMFYRRPGSRLAVPEMWPEDPVAVRVIAPSGQRAFQ